MRAHPGTVLHLALAAALAARRPSPIAENAHLVPVHAPAAPEAKRRTGPKHLPLNLTRECARRMKQIRHCTELQVKRYAKAFTEEANKSGLTVVTVWP